METGSLMDGKCGLLMAQSMKKGLLLIFVGCMHEQEQMPRAELK